MFQQPLEPETNCDNDKNSDYGYYCYYNYLTTNWHAYSGGVMFPWIQLCVPWMRLKLNVDITLAINWLTICVPVANTRHSDISIITILLLLSDVNKDWTCKDKEKDQVYKDQDKDKDLNLVLKESLRTRINISAIATPPKNTAFS